MRARLNPYEAAPEQMQALAEPELVRNGGGRDGRQTLS
jgi:hypothetical protein